MSNIDAFLEELFPPASPGTDFNSRFGAVNDRSGPLYGSGGGQYQMPEGPLPSGTGPMMPPNSGGDDGAMLPPGAGPTSGQAPASLMPPGDVPLPRPRPDIESILAGQGGGSPGAGGPPPMAPGMGGPPGAPSAAPQNPMAALAGRFAGWRPGGGTAVPTPADQPDNASGALGRALGMDASGEKRLRSTIAGGFAGANPAFGGGAFMKGAGGGLSGGLKSDAEDLTTSTAADEREQKQKNFDRAQADKEKISESLRKLYGDRGTAATTNAEARKAGGGKSAWNKPPHERYKDAMKLIQDERKAVMGGINPLGPKADVAAQRAAADKQLKDFTDRTLKTYGIDADGNETSPTQGGAGKPETPSSSRVIGDREAKASGLYPKGTFDDPAAPASQEEFDALPSGTIFKNPADGQMMTKR